MHIPSRHRLALGAAAFALAGIAASAQQAVPPGERPRGLVIDFVAVASGTGLPVTDLTPGEVTIRLNGRVRPIQSLRLMRVAGLADAPAAPDPGALPPPYGASSRSTLHVARNLILVLDNDSFRVGTEPPLREAVNGLLAELGPRDRVMLLTLPYGGPMVPFTRDHGRVRAAIASFVGQRLETETGSDMACRTRRLLESLSGLLYSITPSETPTSVVLLSAAMASPRRDAPMGFAPGMCELETRTFVEVATAAAAARATFYVVHQDDLRRATIVQGPLGSDNPLEGIEHLAGVTGALRLSIAGAGRAALAQIARDTSAYYLAEIEPERSDLEGETQRLSVRVSRPGVDVRARPMISFAPPPALAARRAVPTVHQLLFATEEFADLPMRVTGFTMLGEGDDFLKVVGVAETADPAAVLATAAMALIEPDGRVVAQASAADAAELPLALGMAVPPGMYRLRVAATDTRGRYGTADVDIVAALTPVGPLQLSALMLGLPRPEGLMPRLEFADDPLALASFEIYGVPAEGMRLSAVLEIARTLDGPAIVSNQLAIERADANRLVATGAIPLGALPAGDYIARGIIGIEGGPSGMVVRTLRKQ
jgi:hypothetical protein